MFRISALLLVTLLTIGLMTTAHADVMYRLTQDDVNRVYDGDTIYADIDDLPQFIGEDIGIRIRGIDSPELRSRCDDEVIKSLERERAIEARDRARKILERVAYFDVVNIDMGSFSRLLADIQLPNGKSLAHELKKHRWIRKSGEEQLDWCAIIRERR